MADIRGLIEGDRGIWKRIQAFLPGYKIYRTCEDLRAADNILRQEMARHLEEVEVNIGNSREEIARGMDFDLLNRIGELVNISHTLTEKVRHAEQGYAPWISGDVRIQEDELEALYDYDLKMLDELEKLKLKSDELKKAPTGGGNTAELINENRDAIRNFGNLFDQRIRKVTSVAQKPL